MHKLRFIWHDLHASSPVTVYDKKFALIFGENLSIHTTSVLQIVSSIARFLPIRNQTEHFLSKGHYGVVVLLLHTLSEIPAHRKPTPSSFPSPCQCKSLHEVYQKSVRLKAELIIKILILDRGKLFQAIHDAWVIAKMNETGPNLLSPLLYVPVLCFSMVLENRSIHLLGCCYAMFSSWHVHLSVFTKT